MAIVCVIGEVLNEQYGPIYKKEKDKNKRNNRNLTPTTSCNPTYIQTSQGSQNNKQNNNAKRKRNENQGEKTNLCLKSSNMYFSCREVGHFKKNCPKLKEKKDNASVSAKLNVVNARIAG